LAVHALKFGLLAETTAQLDDLTDLVHGSGHDIAETIRASTGCLDNISAVEVWVVRLDLQHDKSVQLMEILETYDVPVIYDDIESYSELGVAERLNRFAEKIQLCAGTGMSNRPVGDAKKAREIWVLAASTGGPEAVGRFLKTLPENLTGVAFLYVQHINPEISPTLQKAIQSNTQWAVYKCDRSQPLLEKSIYVVSPSDQVSIHATGVITPLVGAWEGPYQPSANQVMAKVARNYGKRSGCIIFSGMGDDGSQSCSFMKGSGGVVWVQSPASCTVDSMPASALATGVVTFQGSPEILARQFVYGRHIGATLSLA